MVQFAFRPFGAGSLGFTATPEGILTTACGDLLEEYIRAVDDPVLMQEVKPLVESYACFLQRNP